MTPTELNKAIAAYRAAAPQPPARERTAQDEADWQDMLNRFRNDGSCEKTLLAPKAEGTSK